MSNMISTIEVMEMINNTREATNTDSALTMMNMVNHSNVTPDCRPEGIFLPGDPPTSQALLVFALVHCYCVTVVGGIGSGVAVWCVCGCSKTRAAVKVLLLTVFLPVLIICVVTMPLMGQLFMGIIFCDFRYSPGHLREVQMLMYSFLAQTELVAIAVVAIVRTVAAWSPHRHGLDMRVSVAIVICILIFSLITCFGILLPIALGLFGEGVIYQGLSVLYFSIVTFLPCITTAACYITMIIAVRHNRRRMAAIRSENGEGGNRVLDQATLAMLAVFCSNLFFSVPHAVYHLLDRQPLNVRVAVHSVFYTHFMVDPLVFIWFNRSYRERVFGCARRGLQYLISVVKQTPSTTLTMQTMPSTSSLSFTKDYAIKSTKGNIIKV